MCVQVYCVCICVCSYVPYSLIETIYLRLVSRPIKGFYCCSLKGRRVWNINAKSHKAH